MRILISLVLSVAAVSSASAQLLNPTEPPPVTLAKGERVPVFDGKTLDGQIRHVSYPKGRITVLMFFLSSCHVCHEMIPEWNRAYARRDKNVDMQGVVIDTPTAAILQPLGIQYPVVLAPAGYRETFKIQRVPQTIRVGEGGEVLDVSLGKIDAMRLGELVRPPDKPAAPAAKSGVKKKAAASGEAR
jgi:hypothetical protein